MSTFIEVPVGKDTVSLNATHIISFSDLGKSTTTVRTVNPNSSYTVDLTYAAFKKLVEAALS